MLGELNLEIRDQLRQRVFRFIAHPRILLVLALSAFQHGGPGAGATTFAAGAAAQTNEPPDPKAEGPITWQDRGLWLAYAVLGTYTPVSYLGFMWPGGLGSAVAFVIGVGVTLYAVRYVRWTRS